MSTTDYPVNHPSARKHWGDELFKEALKDTFAFRFMSEDSNGLVQVRMDTKKDKGDRVRNSLRVQLTGDGVSGDSTLEGNEESLQVYTDDFLVDQQRHAVRSGGEMSEQRVPWEFREEAKDALKDWWSARFDIAFFNQISGNTAQSDLKYTGNNATVAPSSGNIIMEVTDAGGTTASLSTVDTFSIKYIDWAVELAKNATYPIRPITIGGKSFYVLFLHDYQLTDLRREYSSNGGGWGDLHAAALAAGNMTGNPIFSGAAGMYNNTIIHSTSRLPTAGGVANTRRAVFCGAQACSIGFGKQSQVGAQFDWTESSFDYGNQLGVAGKTIWGLKKNVFNGVDLSTIVIPTYAAAHTS